MPWSVPSCRHRRRSGRPPLHAWPNGTTPPLCVWQCAACNYCVARPWLHTYFLPAVGVEWGTGSTSRFCENCEQMPATALPPRPTQSACGRPHHAWFEPACSNLLLRALRLSLSRQGPSAGRADSGRRGVTAGGPPATQGGAPTWTPTPWQASLRATPRRRASSSSSSSCRRPTAHKTAAHDTLSRTQAAVPIAAEGRSPLYFVRAGVVLAEGGRGATAPAFRSDAARRGVRSTAPAKPERNKNTGGERADLQQSTRALGPFALSTALGVGDLLAGGGFPLPELHPHNGAQRRESPNWAGRCMLQA